MSGIAEVLHVNGFEVSGSDTGESPVIDYLKGLGIKIAPKHEAKNVESADLVVYSSAVPHDNPELVEARNRRIPVIRRAEMLGELNGSHTGARFSTLARGLGFGDDLEYADELTLGRSITARQEFKP